MRVEGEHERARYTVLGDPTRSERSGEVIFYLYYSFAEGFFLI